MKTLPETTTELGIGKKRGRPKKVDLKYDVKPVKISKRAQKNRDSDGIDRAAWGPEPTWENTPHKSKTDYSNALGFALNWYSVMATPERLKKWTIEYLKGTKFPADDLNNLSHLPDKLFNTIGSVARCAMRGARLTQSHADYILERAVQMLKDHGTKHSSSTTIVPIAKTRSFTTAQRQLMAEIEEVSDDYLETRATAVLANFDWERLVRASGLDASQIRKVVNSYEPRAQELQGALSGDEYLKESYSHLTKGQQSILVNFYSKVLHLGLEVAPKKQRKPRTRKPQSPEKILRKFQHMHSSKDLKIDSIDPKDILGADELWVFNTKTRKLGFFKAAEGQKLSVKGTSIRDYDEDASFCKKLRKPEEVLEQVRKLAKPATKKYVSGVRSKEQPLRSRINNETILVRAF